MATKHHRGTFARAPPVQFLAWRALEKDLQEGVACCDTQSLNASPSLTRWVLVKSLAFETHFQYRTLTQTEN